MNKRLKSFLRKRLPHSAILFYHKTQGVWAAIRFGMPSRHMTVIGVTGTKGKTTTCHFIASILEEAGFKVGMTSSVNFKIGEKSEPNNRNMGVLPPAELQKLLRQMRDAHCTVAIIEVTSHGLDQYRLWGIPFHFAGLTNITHDHLDYHKSWEQYQAVKLRLFQGKRLKAVAVNGHDSSAELFLQKTTANRRWSYALEDDEPTPRATDHIFADKISSNPSGASFILKSEDEEQRVHLQLTGRFNVENALCAAAICSNLNLKLGTIVAGLERLEHVPGRLERIETRKGFSLMVDYAHTPDSLEKLYSTLRTDVRGRMIAVLGCTGDRDRTKRPIMGALAARFCDYVFVTDEEPYTEDPNQIMDEVAKGVPRGRPLFKAVYP
ncbi:UDP-N-acetylmuramoyl-L-alanyl-D-glutamate--2,6-diaminopimelate ligase, partial [Patescibacteria group bacterium]|nr:UDP-N-acetylmuramoyl-L-alanyl-D-glutamate--2,6-diaminopimelate ligase [Patescibacteria group bacterium]